VRPSSNLSGIQNIALLAVRSLLTPISSLTLRLLQGAQVQHLRERYFVLRSFENLTTVDNAIYMHDYKKQLRALQQGKPGSVRFLLGSEYLSEQPLVP
jgi:hypothetical protein